MGITSGYKRRQPWSFASNAIGMSGSLSDFTTAFRVPAGNDFWNNAPSDGRHVLITTSDGVTPIEFELEAMVAGGERGYWHPKLPTLSHSAPTEGYIYYSPLSPSNNDDKEGSLDAFYRAAWRLNQDKPEGAFDDSTSNNNDLTNIGTTDRAGSIDRGVNLDGTNDYMHANPSLGGDWSGAFTIETIINPDTLAAATTESIFDIGSADVLAFMYVNNSGSKTPEFWVFDETSDTWKIAISSVALSIATEYHIVTRCEIGGNQDIVINDVLRASIVAPTSIRTTATTGVSIGASSGTIPFNGMMDETTVSVDIFRSNDWIKARNQSRLGTWLSFGDEEILAGNTNSLLLGVG